MHTRLPDITACRYRYVAFYWWSLEWWGGMCYAIGVVGYNMAAFTAVIYDCHPFGADAYVGLPCVAAEHRLCSEGWTCKLREDPDLLLCLAKQASRLFY